MNEPQKNSSIKQVETYFDQFDFLNAENHLSLVIPAHLKIELYKAESGFIFDSNNGFIYTLNHVATFILSLLMETQNHHSLSEITRIITETFDSTSREAEDDLIEFICHLKDFGIEVKCAHE